MIKTLGIEKREQRKGKGKGVVLSEQKTFLYINNIQQPDFLGSLLKFSAKVNEPLLKVVKEKKKKSIHSRVYEFHSVFVSVTSNYIHQCLFVFQIRQWSAQIAFFPQFS